MIVLETLNKQMCLEEDFYNESIDLLKRKMNPLIVENVTILQEGKISDFFKELWEHIKALWQKFIATLDSVFKSNEAWFKKYEDDLMNANLRDFEWNMIPYWEGNSALEKCKIPIFNPLDKKQLEYCSSTESYRAWIKSNYLENDKRIDTGDGFTDGLEYVFRGKEATLMKGTEIASVLRSCIAYCKDFKSVSQKVNQDYNNIEKCVKYAQKQAIRRSNGPDDNADSSNKSESFNFDLFNEDGNNNDTTNVNVKETITGTQGHKIPEDQRKKVDEANKELMEKRKDNLSNSVDKTNADKKDFSDADIQEKNMTKAQADERVACYKNYVIVSQQVLSTKLKILKERYDMYMKMFKAILDVSINQKNITGDKGNSGVKIKGKDYYIIESKKLVEILNEQQKKEKDAKVKEIIGSFVTQIKVLTKNSQKENNQTFRDKLVDIINRIKASIPTIQVKITKITNDIK